MAESLRPYGLLLGRVLMSVIFLVSGTMKIFAWDENLRYMTAKNMPLPDTYPVLLAAALTIELLGGLALLLGGGTRIAALVLTLFLIPATLVFHDFWNVVGAAQQNQMIHFLKNLTIMGGLLTLAAAGAGALSLDGLLGWSGAAGPVGSARSSEGLPAR